MPWRDANGCGKYWVGDHGILDMTLVFAKAREDRSIREHHM